MSPLGSPKKPSRRILSNINPAFDSYSKPKAPSHDVDPSETSPRRTRDDAWRKKSTTTPGPSSVAQVLPTGNEPEISTYSVDTAPKGISNLERLDTERHTKDEHAVDSDIYASEDVSEGQEDDILLILWTRHNIVKRERQEQISQLARSKIDLYCDIVEQKSGKVTPGQYSKMLLAYAENITLRYVKKREARMSQENSRASSRMSAHSSDMPSRFELACHFLT